MRFPLQLARTFISSKNTAIVSLQVNQAKNSQISKDSTGCSEQCAEYCDVPDNPELLWCRDLGLLDNNHRHGAVDESERERANLPIVQP